MTDADGLFIKMVSEGSKPSTAYMKAYGDNVEPGRKAHDLIRNDKEINQSIEERLQAVGITERKLHKTLNKQLNATKVIYYDPKLSKDIVDDNDAQLKAVTTGYKLLGLLKDNQTYVDARQVTFSGDPAALLKVVHEMKQVDTQAIDIDGEVV
jgi:small-conductance mechanosensitive channel